MNREFTFEKRKRTTTGVVPDSGYLLPIQYYNYEYRGYACWMLNIDPEWEQFVCCVDLFLDDKPFLWG